MPPPTKEQLAMAPWMRFARAELGTVEGAGEANNARVLGYLEHCKGPRSLLQQDSTAWCSAFANACMHSVGIAGTESLAARSWLRYGDAIELKDARFGDVVVLWRGVKLPASVLNAPGHVAFFDRLSGDQIFLLGGNQRQSVSVQPYPLRRVLAIRRPSVAELALHDLMRKSTV